METWWFSKLIARYPYPILVAVFLFSSTCLIVPLATRKLPDFTDPQLGFEARGTRLSQRFTAWQNLIDATGVRGTLIDNPIEYFHYLEQLNNQNKSDTRHRITQGIVRKNPKEEKLRKGKKYAKKANQTDKNLSTTGKDKWEEILELGNKNKLENTPHEERTHSHLSDDGFFCNAPNSAYARVVLGTESGRKNIWSMESVLAQCHIDGVLRANGEFPSLCQTYTDHSSGQQKCCRSWSPANYVALLSNRTSCLGVTEEDLTRVQGLLERCAYYYKNKRLVEDCADNLNCQAHVPRECYSHNAFYHLLHYLLDANFLLSDKTDKDSQPNTTGALMIFLPIAASSASLHFYRALSNTDLSYCGFRVLGMELGLKSTLFDDLLVTDSSLVLSGFAFVTICIWAYTGSVLMTLSTIMAVVFSLGISYAIYTIVLGITFFPFMNLLAIVVAVGIGADDAFIFCNVWKCGKKQKMTTGGLERLVQETMRHAVPSMFVTSLTTAIAFFASIVSNVTAINCFSLFSGITVIANFFLMITWLPASMVVSEKRLAILSPTSFMARKIVRPLRVFSNKLLTQTNECLGSAVIKFRWIWLPLLSTVAIAGCVVVFHYPGLRLPDLSSFQLFDSTHPFEIYDLVYARKFRFERSETDSSEMLPLRFVWGIKPVDNGDNLDPSSRGSLEWDESFDITDPASQIWLQQFCYDLRAQSFYHDTMGPLLSNCFIESLKTWMSRRCADIIDPNVNHAPCCESSLFPYTPTVLRQCVAEANADLYRTPSHLWTRGGTVAGGVKFLKESMQLASPLGNYTKMAPVPLPKIMALIVEYDSTQPYSLSYSDMHKFYNEVEDWMQKQLSGAPSGMRGGWFVSRLEFYELQRTLYEGTIWAMGVSMTLALGVLALVTLNPLVSLYAIVAIGAAIVVTVASLVLLGWKLNVLESLAVSTAIGLAVDFSLHYGVSYRACDSVDRIDRVKAALQQMAGPSLMAAVTSGAAGAFMLPSHVLAYIQIGIFLLLVMSISWCYATFFLCPLLAIAGPSGSFAQFHYPTLARLFSCFPEFDTNEIAMGIARNNETRRNGGGRGRVIFTESTLSVPNFARTNRAGRAVSTGRFLCGDQLLCGDHDGLSSRLAAPDPMPPSPSLSLLFLDCMMSD